MGISPYDEGVIAANDSGGVDDNPYTEGTEQHTQWENGFQDTSWAPEDTSGYERALNIAKDVRDRLKTQIDAGMHRDDHGLAQSKVDMLSRELKKGRSG